MPTLKDPQLVGFAAGMEAVIDRVQTIVKPLSAERRRREPVPGSWSVDQVLEHLCIANGFYLKRMQRLIDGSLEQPRTGPGTWKPTLGGRLLLRFLDPRSKRKLRSPTISRPGPSPRDGVLETFVQQMRDIEQLMVRADGLALKHYRFRSPFARFIKLNLGDAFAVSVVHAQRHLGQIERAITATA